MTSYLLAQALQKNRDLVIADCVSDAALVASSLATTKPNVLLASIHLKALVADRFRQLAAILASHPDVACVVLLDSSDPETVVDAFRARVKGVFVCVESNTEMLHRCIRRVVEGQVWADSAQMNYIIAALPSAHQPESGTRRKVSDTLTPREEDVVWHMLEGLSNREIAGRLQLSENTVKNYVFHILEKLGFSNRVEVVLYAASRLQQHETGAVRPFLAKQGGQVQRADAELSTTSIGTASRSKLPIRP
jgi:DNA-binding NarL/FixJ family response regulator